MTIGVLTALGVFLVGAGILAGSLALIGLGVLAVMVAAILETYARRHDAERAS